MVHVGSTPTYPTQQARGSQVSTLQDVRGWQLKSRRLVKRRTKINADINDIDAEYEALCASYTLISV